MSRMSVTRLKKMKQDRVPISVITAYDYPSAKLAEEAGVDVILVGDSLGNVVLGYDSTIPVTLDDMVYHTRAVARASQKSFIVADMPFLTYHGSIDQTLKNAARLMQEGHANGIKMEGGAEICLAVDACVKAGVPVIGHLGLTPQSVYQIGGYKVQGKHAEDAQKLLEDALALERAGASAIVLELVTEEVAAHITSRLSIPTIGIGAGRGCDGQVLVFHDILQYASPYFEKKFVKTYANIGEQIRGAIAEYVREVKGRQYPDESHIFSMDEETVASLYGSGSSVPSQGKEGTVKS